MLQELLKGEQQEFLGAERYERGSERCGQRNGYETAHVDTAEGRIELLAPQVRGSAECFSSPLLMFLRGRTEVLERLVTEVYAHGLSTRDIEAAFTDATGGWVLSKRLVSEVTERLWAEYQAFRPRCLDDLAVEYLFCDRLYEPLRRTGTTADSAAGRREFGVAVDRRNRFRHARPMLSIMVTR